MSHIDILCTTKKKIHLGCVGPILFGDVVLYISFIEILYSISKSNDSIVIKKQWLSVFIHIKKICCFNCRRSTTTTTTKKQFYGKTRRTLVRIIYLLQMANELERLCLINDLLLRRNMRSCTMVGKSRF